MSEARQPSAPTGVQRWGGYVAFVVIFAIACGLLSWWQWARRDEAVGEIVRVETNYDAPAEAVERVLPKLDTADEELEWLPVVLRGEYLSEYELLVRNRVRDGLPGFEVLVPFQLQSGEVFVVNRGWLQEYQTLEELMSPTPTQSSGERRGYSQVKSSTVKMHLF